MTATPDCATSCLPGTAWDKYRSQHYPRWSMSPENGLGKGFRDIIPPSPNTLKRTSRASF